MPSRPEDVRAGKNMVRQQTDTQFALGDLVMDLTEKLDESPSRHEILENFADALNISSDTLNRYRRVSAAWPQAKRSRDASWAVHAILAPHPCRFELIRHPPPPRKMQWTCSEAHAVMDSQRKDSQSSA